MTGHELQLRCKENFNALGIQSTKDFKAHLRQIFETSSDQVQALEAIYKTVLPDWDRIEAVEAHPEAGDELWCFICRLFVDFDKEHHPEVFNGGLWLNNGFSGSSNLDPWQISLLNCRVRMK